MDLLFGNSNFRGFGFGYSNSQKSLNKNQNGTLESWNRRTSGTLTAVGLQSWVDFA